MKQIKLQEVSKQYVLNSDRKDYNPYEWTKAVNRYYSYQECKFYVEKDFERENFYAVYVIDGVRMLKEFSYISSLDCMSFRVVSIDNEGNLIFEDRQRESSVEVMKFLSSKGYILTKEF